MKAFIKCDLFNIQYFFLDSQNDYIDDGI